MTINSVAQEISDTGYGSPGLRDEVYIQLCKQVSDNPRRESLRRGWELLGEWVSQNWVRTLVVFSWEILLNTHILLRRTYLTEKSIDNILCKSKNVQMQTHDFINV